MNMLFRTGDRVRGVGSIALAVLVGACVGSAPAKPTNDGGATGGAGAAGKVGTGGTVGGTGGRGGAGAGIAGQNGSAGAGGTGVAPTVVATLGRVPASLALDGANLYVSLPETAAGGDGLVVKLPKTSLNATLDAGGGITTLASGLPGPRTIAVDGVTVYWSDSEAALPHYFAVFAVPTAGGPVVDVTGSNYYVTNRIAIANNVLYAFSGNADSIAAFPLAGAAGQVIYPGPGAGNIGGIDADGTSVFFLVTRMSNTWDLSQIPVGGGTETVLVTSMLHGQALNDNLVHDATSIYVTDQATGNLYSLPKTGGMPKLLASGVAGNNLQIAVDANDIYVLGQQSLSRIPKTGGTPVVLASVQSTASADGYLISTFNTVALAVDDAYVYWLWQGHGQILKLAK